MSAHSSDPNFEQRLRRGAIGSAFVYLLVFLWKAKGALCLALLVVLGAWGLR